MTCVCALTAQAETFYSTLTGPQLAFSNDTYTIAGADNWMARSASVGVAFTPGVTGRLDAVDLAMSTSMVHFLFPKDVSVTLHASEAGLPGAVIETLGTVSELPTKSRWNPPAVTTVYSSTRPMLVQGTEYFLTINAEQANAIALWHQSSDDALKGIYRADAPGAAWTLSPDELLPAFAVQGTAVGTLSFSAPASIAPTPSALGAGLLGLLVVARRR
ncbi:hypothetical protein [Mucisphaera calidilacus]|uniref:hypothetical protein n=1 Tax=Mucisphaera calidilacus TaxID=2527982 RepID=UPI0011AAAFF2|nr:hypothetical protein [Mucisphaera calidilacus]